MVLKTVFCDNYFPPTIIEVIKYKSGEYENKTQYRIGDVAEFNHKN